MQLHPHTLTSGRQKGSVPDFLDDVPDLSQTKRWWTQEIQWGLTSAAQPLLNLCESLSYVLRDLPATLALEWGLGNDHEVSEIEEQAYVHNRAVVFRPV